MQYFIMCFFQLKNFLKECPVAHCRHRQGGTPESKFPRKKLSRYELKLQYKRYVIQVKELCGSYLYTKKMYSGL